MSIFTMNSLNDLVGLIQNMYRKKTASIRIENEFSTKIEIGLTKKMCHHTGVIQPFTAKRSREN